MTKELEKQFFDTFGIEPREFKSCDVGTFCPYEGQLCDDTCPYYRTYKVDYPAISDRILLELICLGTQFFAELVLLTSDNIEDLKEQVLTIYLKTAYKEKIKHQVRTLFEEG